MFRWRQAHTLNRQRLGLAVVLLALIPVATSIPAWSALAIVDLLIWAMIAYEQWIYDERRDELRREFSVAHPSTD
jgi:4-hydroxybenzoate polyprenyltransferase